MCIQALQEDLDAKCPEVASVSTQTEPMMMTTGLDDADDDDDDANEPTDNRSAFLVCQAEALMKRREEYEANPVSAQARVVALVASTVAEYTATTTTTSKASMSSRKLPLEPGLVQVTSASRSSTG